MTGWDDALTDLVRARRQALTGYAYLFTHDAREAEDLVQDALVAVFARGRGTDIERVEAYVRRTIRNTYLDGFRRRRRWAAIRHLTVAPDAQPSSDTAHVDHVPIRVDVQRALRALSPRERACVVLRFFDDLTVPQIATELALAQGTVKRYLSDALARLEAQLGPLPGPALDDLDAARGGA
ncbi:MAG: RNA polymerase sigma factor [Cellulomonadaceae bacterium]